MHSLHRAQRERGLGMGWMDIVIIRIITLHRAPGEENGMDGYSYYQDTCTCVTPTSQSTHESKGATIVFEERTFLSKFFFCCVNPPNFHLDYQILGALARKVFNHPNLAIPCIKLTRVLQNCRFSQNWPYFQNCISFS